MFSLLKTPHEFQTYCKQVTSKGSTGTIPMVKYFEYHGELQVDSLTSVCAEFKKLAKLSNYLLIRASLNNIYKDKYLIKNVIPLVERGKNAFISGTKQKVWVNTNPLSEFLYFDIDKLMLPLEQRVEGWGTNVPLQAEFIRKELHKREPNFFPEDVGIVVHASNTAGLGGPVRKGLVRVHAVVQNTHKLSQLQIKELGAGVLRGLIDQAIYSPCQPHITSDPIYTGGGVFIWEGKERVVHVEGVLANIPNTIKEHEPVTYYANAAAMALYDSWKDNMLGMPLIPKDLLPTHPLAISWHKLHDNNLFTKGGSGEGFKNTVKSLCHRAVQHCYDVSSVREQALPRVKYLRPIDGEQELDLALVHAVNKVMRASAINTVPIGHKAGGATILKDMSGRYVRLANVAKLPKRGTIYINSGTGTGKSHFSADLAQGHGDFEGMPQLRTLAVAHLNSIVDQLKDNFNAVDLRIPQERAKFVSGEVDNCVCTLQSLAKIHDVIPLLDLVVIDEVDAVLRTLALPNITIKLDKKQDILNVLTRLLTEVPRALLLDADISAHTHEAVKFLTGDMPVPKFLLTHNWKRLEGVESTIWTESDKFWDYLVFTLGRCLPLKQTVFLGTDYTPKNVKAHAAVIRKILLGMGIEVTICSIHSEQEEDSIGRDIQRRRGEAVADNGVELLITSPSITSGIDFVGVFDHVFLVTSEAGVTTPSDRWQQLSRERAPKTINILANNVGPLPDNGHTSALVSIENGLQEIYRKEKTVQYSHYTASIVAKLIHSGSTVLGMDFDIEDFGGRRKWNSKDIKKEAEIIDLETSQKILTDPLYREQLDRLKKYSLIDDISLNDILDFVSTRMPWDTGRDMSSIGREMPLLYYAILECEKDEVSEQLVVQVRAYAETISLILGAPSAPRYSQWFSQAAKDKRIAASAKRILFRIGDPKAALGYQKIYEVEHGIVVMKGHEIN